MALLALAGCAQDRYQWNLSHAAFASSARRLPESERQEIVRLVSHATTERLSLPCPRIQIVTESVFSKSPSKLSSQKL